MRFKLTEKMLDHLQDRLEQYHKIFSGDGCKGIPLEELVYIAIQADFPPEQVRWVRGGHDVTKDIEIYPDSRNPHLLQVKAGQIRGNYVVLSGNRLGRFTGNRAQYTKFLNGTTGHTISAAYKRSEINSQVTHTYEIRYISPNVLHGVTADNWQQTGQSFVQENSRGVKFRIRKSLSWQVWWSLPIKRFRPKRTITI